MLFTEPIFLFVFLPLMLAVCAWGSLRWRNSALAFGSLLFYAWDHAPYVAVLCFSIGLNYLVGIKAGSGSSPRVRKIGLALGIVGNLLVLGHFKYTGFILENLNPLVMRFGWSELPVPVPNMPLGISFFTFQAMSYVVDVYRGKTQVQRNLIDLTLYISLFPQLIAGPIVRYHEIARQIYVRSVTNRGFSVGIYRFIIGLSKKLLIADTLAQPAEIVFALSLDELTMPLAWAGLLCFTLQIYFDFSGYSDMAIGMGRMFGFKIPENFNYPYISRSVTEFWRRWHMTLSRWFRDYLYIPLGGNRCSAGRLYLNLFVVFLLCGFWHGASWSFILWGFVHGMFLTFERMGLVTALEHLGRPLATLYTLAAVLLGWVFFQCTTIDHAFGFLSVLGGLSFGGNTFYQFRDVFTNDVAIAFVIGVIGGCPLMPAIRKSLAGWIRGKVDRSVRRRRSSLVALLANLGLAGLFFACCMRAMANTYTPFLYFRF